MADEFSRYSRQVVLPQIGVNGQALLRDSTVLIVGLGGLGSAAALYLAGAGIGRLLLCDRDRVERSNLQRQIVYREADIGRPKIEAAAAQLTALNGELAIETLVGPLDETALLAAVRRADLVLDCSDNFSTRYAVNAACLHARRPLVSGAAIRFEGQLALFDPARGGPCYACLFPPGEDEGGEGDAERCEDAGVLGPVVGVIGTMQALLALRRLLGLGDDVGVLHLWDAARMNWKSVNVLRDKHCPVCARVTA